MPQINACRDFPAARAGHLPLPWGGEGRGEGASFGSGRDGSVVSPPTLALPLAGGGKRLVPAGPYNIEVGA